MYFLYFLIILYLALFVALVILVNNRFKGKGQFGLNSKITNCPNCDKELPTFRIPKSFNQVLCGGWTCEVCQTDFDNWGNILNSKNDFEVDQRQIDQGKTEFLESFDEAGKTPVERLIDDK